MRVAVVGYPLLSERQWRLCSAFEAKGVETHVLVPDNWPRIDPAEQPPANAPFAVHRHRARFTGYQGRYILRRIGRTLRDVDPDAVVVHAEPWHLLTLWVDIVSQVSSIPNVVFTWENLDRMPQLRVQQLLERISYPMTDGIIAGSGAAEDRIRDRGFSGPTTVAPQTGIDVDRFSPDAADPSIRTEFDLPSDARIVTYAGRLAHEKGLDLLMETAPEILNAHDDVHYLVIGEGPMSADVRTRIDDGGLQEGVTFVPEWQPHDRMAAITAESTLFVYPSRTTETWAEQFGYAVAEAMGCGVPVVTTDCGSLPSVVGDGGVVCPEDDPEALTAAISDLLDDERRRRTVARAGRERARNTFRMEQVADAHLTFVREFVE